MTPSLASVRSSLAVIALSIGACALAAGCTFASPTTSTYNAGKVASTADGGAGSTSSASSTSSGSTTTDDSSLCCKQSSGMSAGTCIPTSAVPAGSASETVTDTCSSGNTCVPTDQISGTPTKCGVAGGLLNGVCLGTCFSQYLSLASFVLKSDACGADDACVPCEALKGTMVAGCDQ